MVRFCCGSEYTIVLKWSVNLCANYSFCKCYASNMKLLATTKTFPNSKFHHFIIYLIRFNFPIQDNYFNNSKSFNVELYLYVFRKAKPSMFLFYFLVNNINHRTFHTTYIRYIGNFTCFKFLHDLSLC